MHYPSTSLSGRPSRPILEHSSTPPLPRAWPRAVSKSSYYWYDTTLVKFPRGFAPSYRYTILPCSYTLFFAAFFTHPLIPPLLEYLERAVVRHSSIRSLACAPIIDSGKVLSGVISQGFLFSLFARSPFLECNFPQPMSLPPLHGQLWENQSGPLLWLHSQTDCL